MIENSVNRLLLLLIPTILLFNNCISLAVVERFIPAYSLGFVVIDDIGRIKDQLKQASLQSLDNDLIPDKLNYLKDQLKNFNLVGNRIAIVWISVLSLKPSIIVELDKSSDLPEQIKQIFEKKEVDQSARLYQGIPFGLLGDNRYTVLDNTLIISPSKEDFESILKVYNLDEAPISEDPKYILVSDKVLKAGQITVYFNTELVNPIIWGLARRTDMQVLGIYDISALIWKINLFDPGASHEMFLLSKTPNNILLSMFSGKRPFLSPHILPVSNSPIYCVIQAEDPTSLWDKFISNIRDIAGEEDLNQLNQSISKFEMETDLKFREDLLSLLSGEFGISIPSFDCIAASRRHGSLLRDGALIFYSVSDVQKAISVLDKLFTPAYIEKTEYKGIKISYVPSLNGPEGPVGYLGIENMVLIGNLKGIQNVLEDDLYLILDERFNRIISRSDREIGSIFYLDLSRIAQHFGISDLTGLPSLGILTSSIDNGLMIKVASSGEKSWIDIISSIIHMLNVARTSSR